jgi:hypothetical protein
VASSHPIKAPKHLIDLAQQLPRFRDALDSVLSMYFRTSNDGRFEWMRG